jgi:radical SAM superfamily enzyme YgiQ (UPF0313 family)
VHFASECGIQVGALLMVGLPHDTPERLMHTVPTLLDMGCTYYDLRILRIYPSTPLYKEMLASGDVTENWWLKKESDSNCNELLPSCLSMDFKHPGFSPMQLQHTALKLTVELNPMRHDTMGHILRVGHRARALRFAALLLAARHRSVRQARKLMRQVEKAMANQAGVRPQGLQLLDSAAR